MGPLVGPVVLGCGDQGISALHEPPHPVECTNLPANSVQASTTGPVGQPASSQVRPWRARGGPAAASGNPV